MGKDKKITRFCLLFITVCLFMCICIEFISTCSDLNKEYGPKYYMVDDKGCIHKPTCKALRRVNNGYNKVEYFKEADLRYKANILFYCSSCIDVEEYKHIIKLTK